MKNQNAHILKNSADDLPNKIAQLMQREELFQLVQPYIDNHFEKLAFAVISSMNTDKLTAISNLRKNPHKTFLIAKSEYVHRFRGGIVHMENAYDKSYALFLRSLNNALRVKGKMANGNKGKRQPARNQVATPNAHAYHQRLEAVIKIVNLFVQRYSDEYNKIRQHLFMH